jgi:formylglycine-generating enzyme required for sulfatase activity
VASKGGQGGRLPGLEVPGCVHPQVVPECSDGFCKIPSGCFIMGSPEDEPGRGLRNEEQTAVTLTHDYLIGQYEVTQDDFALQGLANPSKVFTSGPRIGKGDCLEPECPVGNVTWYEAVAFANLLSERSEPPLEKCYVLEECTGELGQGLTCRTVRLSRSTVYECEGYRLPTDAEWEYAAGTRSAFYSGDIDLAAEPGTCTRDAALEGIAWYCGNSDFTSFPVGQLAPNGWGLYDVLGNLEEWINDPDDGRSSPSVQDPRGKLNNSTARYTRGGGVFVWPTACRAASQGTGVVDLPTPVDGFRLARTLLPSGVGGTGGEGGAH